MSRFDELLSTDEIRASRTHDADDDMDLTPMVDVTFLLLIFFMITAAFAVQKAIGVPAMQDEEAVAEQIVDDPQEDTIIVRIDAENVFWIGAPKWSEEQRTASTSTMQSKLREARADGPLIPTKMLVQAHGDARHGKVVAALDAGADVGIEQISLLSYEDGDLGF